MDKKIKKIKLLYSGELLLFSIVFLVLGILELLAVIKLSERFQLIFKIITLVGATWLVTDFILVLVLPKRRKNNSLMDKIMVLPLVAYLYTFDILGFVLNPSYGYYQVGVPIAFIYLACAYCFQAIYHYYHPIPMIQEAIDEVLHPEEPEEVVDAKPVEEKEPESVDKIEAKENDE